MRLYYNGSGRNIALVFGVKSEMQKESTLVSSVGGYIETEYIIYLSLM